MTTARGAGRILLCLMAAAPTVGLWMASPQLMVHWSASGQVFVRAADSGMQRLGFADGLAPLRYSALEATACGELPCRLETSAGVIVLSESGDCRTAPDAVLVLILSDRLGDFPNTYHWTEVSKAGWLTARRGDSGLDVQVGAACRNRP
ncbi:hypothetical protein [Hyphomonas sp.]|uniref:hypothetical protein n=1 Tax=Hyphomonas sp. TaxID=87 RepID=UPI0039E56E71